MSQDFKLFFRFIASFCIGQISHQQHKGYSKDVHNLSIMGLDDSSQNLQV